MTAVPRVLKWAVTGLIVVLVGVAVTGSAEASNVHWGAGLGALFLTVYFGGPVYAGTMHSSRRASQGKHRRTAAIWLLVLTLIWVGLLVASTNAMWMAFPLILLQVGVLGTAWGSLAAFLTASAAVVASLYRLPEGTSARGSILGPIIGAAVAVTFMWGIMTIARQSRERQDALEELQQARTLLARAEHDRVVIAERQHLAGELHDTVAQGLSATAMLLRAAQGLYRP